MSRYGHRHSFGGFQHTFYSAIRCGGFREFRRMRRHSSRRDAHKRVNRWVIMADIAYIGAGRPILILRPWE